MNGFQRMTEQRRLILEVLQSTDCHPTADWVYEHVRAKLPTISLGTIYRNLRALAAMGMALELNFGSGQDRFDGNPEPHYHFRCQDCGRVFDLLMPENSDLETEAARVFSGQIWGHRLEFYGRCADCQHAVSDHNQ